MPGEGMILWGASPLYIIRKGVILTTLKSTSRRQGLRGDPKSERSWRANLRADGQKPHIRPNPWERKHNIPKPVRRTWGMVNAAVVQGKIMFLPGEICPGKNMIFPGQISPGKNMIFPGEICPTLRPPLVVALHVVMHEVIGQKTENCSCFFCISAFLGGHQQTA